MKVKLIHEKALMPQRGENGFTIFSPKMFKIGGRRMEVVRSGIQIQIPSGYVGIIKSSRKYARIGFLLNEIIDEHYREEIVLPIFNEGFSERVIVRGDPIATMTLVPTTVVNCEEDVEKTKK